MQMSLFLVIYCKDHLWKVGAISIFYLKAAAANTEVSHCNGGWRRCEENFVTLMSGFVEAPPQCPRVVPVCCAAQYFLIPHVCLWFSLSANNELYFLLNATIYLYKGAPLAFLRAKTEFSLHPSCLLVHPSPFECDMCYNSASAVGRRRRRMLFFSRWNCWILNELMLKWQIRSTAFSH